MDVEALSRGAYVGTRPITSAGGDCGSHRSRHFLRAVAVVSLAACASTPILETPYDQLEASELSLVIMDARLRMRSNDPVDQRTGEADFMLACSYYREKGGRSHPDCPQTAEEDAAAQEFAKPVRQPPADPIAPCSAEEYVRRQPPPDWAQSHEDSRVALRAGDQRLLLHVLCPAAASEVPEAEFALCLLVNEGAMALEKDLPSAEGWCRRSIAHGHLPAEEVLGMVLLEYQARRENYQEATELFVRAAARGSGRAALELADIHAEGRFIERNLKEARRWALIAQERNVPEAAELLGNIEAEIERRGGQ